MENITVYARFIPLKEKSEIKSTNFIIDSKKITNKKTKEIYNFDSILNQLSSIKDIFKKLLKQNISHLFKNINISVFSYGQSETGKRFLFNGEQKSNEGLIHLSLKEIFNILNNNKNTSINKYIVKIYYIQIYNEEIYNLIGEIPNQTLDVNCLSDIIVNNYEEAIDILNKGEINKNDLNDKVNKNYCNYIFKISLEHNNKDKKCITSMTFIDLAGSENITQTKDKEKEVENNTTKSLLSFNNIINKLYKKNTHLINYKESILTTLLQNTFNNKNKIIFFCSMIDDTNNYQETVNTLNFAKKLKNIKLNNININNKIKDKKKQENENKALRNKIKLLEKIIKDKKSMKEKGNIKNKYKNNNSNLNNNSTDINNKQIKNLEKEISLLKQYLLYNNSNEEYNSDIKSNIDFIDYTDYTSEQGFNEICNTSIKPRFNLSSIKRNEALLKSPFFSSPFSNTKNIINELQGNKNNFQKNICMTEMRPEQGTHSFLLNNSVMGKTEPPNYNFIENQNPNNLNNMNISFPDLNNSFINSGGKENENNYLIKENEELKKNIDEIKKTYNDIMQSKEEEINLINQNHDLALENCEKIIKDAENSYIILKSDYDKAIETIKLKENELNNLRQENINQDSSIKFYQKQLDKIGDFDFANNLELKYNELLEENKELKENGNKINIKLKQENELLKQNIDMIENKYKEKCKEVNNNKKIISENNKMHEKELQKYKIEIKNYIAISKKNKDKVVNVNMNLNNEDNKIKEYENKINKLIAENNEYKNNLEIIEKTQINEYQKLLDESFAKIAELNREINGTNDKNKYLEETLNSIENKKNEEFLNKKRKRDTLKGKHPCDNEVNKKDEIIVKTPNKENKENNNDLNKIISNFEI